MSSGFGIVDKLSPVFSVNTLIDTDIGLMNMIIRDYNDPKIFDLDHDYYDLFSRVHYRHYKNPLYALCKPDADRLDLDDYYEEFINTKMDTIFELTVLTEMPNICRIYKDDGAFEPVIMCDEGIYLDQIKTVTMIADIDIKSFKDIYSERGKYTQFFLRDIDELRKFDNRILSTFYLPDTNINFTDKGELRDRDLAETFVSRKNNLSCYSLYNESIIRNELYDKYETLDSYLYKLEEDREEDG